MARDASKVTTLEYVETIELGAIVAFKSVIKGSERTLSGKLVKRIVDKHPGGERTAVIETKNGSTFCVDFDDIIWVKTGERWPRWVFDELKKK